MLVAGCATFLLGCDDAAYPTNKTIYFDGTQRDLYVQPIQVCNDFGENCAAINLFADITAKILEQARLTVNFLPTRRLNDSRFLTIDDSPSKSSESYEFYELSRSGKAGDYGRHPQSTRDSGPINVWFVDNIAGSAGYIQFGLGWVDANGVLISSAALDYNGGKGRVDTLAHELGHNLGLKHSTLGAGGANNLLTAGDRRNVPSSADDIYPDGAGLSQLTRAQIEEIINSPFVSRQSADSQSANNRSPISTRMAADLTTFSLVNLQIGASEDVNKIPEPSTWGAIALIGLSSMLLLKRREDPASDRGNGACSYF